LVAGADDSDILVRRVLTMHWSRPQVDSGPPERARRMPCFKSVESFGALYNRSLAKEAFVRCEGDTVRYPGLDLVTMELIAAAAEEGSITRAALRTHLALAAASRRISDFEHRTGVQVFERKARGVRVTVEAEPLLARIRAVLAAAQHLHGAMEDARRGVSDHVRLLANSYVIGECLPSMLQRFRASHPNVRVEIEERSSLDIVEAIVQRRASLGLLWADVNTHGLATLPLGEDELTLIVPVQHPLARRGAVRFADALEHEFVMFEDTSPVTLLLWREAARLGASVRGRVQLRGLDAVCRMVEAGLGIGIVPRRAAQSFAKSMSIASVILREGWAERRLIIAYRSEHELAPLEHSFIATAQEGSNKAMPGSHALDRKA